MQIVGLDLSLNATGLAWAANGHTQTETLKPPKGITGLPRLDWICCQVRERTATVQLVVMEGLSFASKGQMSLERAGLAYAVRLQLWRLTVPFVTVPPSTLKKFVTGSGKAEKNKMLLEVWRRWHIEAADDNQADAVGLVMIGRALVEPMPLIQAQVDVIHKIERDNREVLEAVRVRENL